MNLRDTLETLVADCHNAASPETEDRALDRAVERLASRNAPQLAEIGRLAEEIHLQADGSDVRQWAEQIVGLVKALEEGQ